MAEPSKAIGLRLPTSVWDKLKEYGLEHYPSDKSKEGIDVTQSIVTLLKQALDISLDDYISQSNTTLDERITAIVKQSLDDATNSVGFTHQEVRDIAAATIKDSIAFEKLVDKGEVIEIADRIVTSAFNPLSQSLAELRAVGSIEQQITAQIEPIADQLTELESFVQAQIKAVRDELKKPLAIAL